MRVKQLTLQHLDAVQQINLIRTTDKLKKVQLKKTVQIFKSNQCEDLLFFSVLYHCKLNIFRFWTDG